MEDYGRERVTRTPSDRYAFRTPPLRNVQLTGPWGHAGQYSTLHGIIDHHREPEARLRSYDVTQLEPGLRGMLADNADQLLATGSPLLTGPPFEPDVTELLVRFLGSLTHPGAQNLSHLIPVRVPSGLPVD
jgi:cytochrome c peroxidase